MNGLPRVLNDEERYMLYLQRPDLDWRGALPELRTKFVQARVFIDTNKVGQMMFSTSSKGKVLQCWRILLEGERVYEHTLTVLRRTDFNSTDETSVVLVLDDSVVHEIRGTRSLFSHPKTVWHSWTASDGEGPDTLFTVYRITQELYNSELRLEINGKTFGSTAKSPQLNRQMLLALPSVVQQVLQEGNVVKSKQPAQKGSPHKNLPKGLFRVRI